MVQIIYIVGFSIRVALAYFFIGIQYLFYYGVGAPPPTLNFTVLIAIVSSDLLVMLG